MAEVFFSFPSELQEMLDVAQKIGANKFPATKTACRAAAKYIAFTWKQYVLGGKAIKGKIVKNREYANSIQIEKISDFKYRIYAEGRAVSLVENGRKGFDLKDYLPFPKSRISKKGDWYSIIPFRHKLKDIYRTLKDSQLSTALWHEIKKLKRDFIEGTKQVPSLSYGVATKLGFKRTTKNITRYIWKWAKTDKILQSKLKGTRIAGIRRVAKDVGGIRRSVYLTFRTISTRQRQTKPMAWVIPPIEGIPVSKEVAKDTYKEVIKIIQEALNQDFSLL